MRFLVRLALLAVIAVIAGAAVYQHVLKLQNEATAFSNTVIPAVVTNWNPTALYERSSPEFKAATTLDQVYSSFQKAGALGPMESYQPPKVAANVFYAFGKGLVRSAAVRTTAEFQRGEAEILMTIVKVGDQWHVQTFNYNSPDLVRLVLTGTTTGTESKPSTGSKPAGKLTVQEAQHEAVRRYPDIGVANSKLNRAFIARQKQYQSEQPDFFQNPAWPLVLAEEVARATDDR